MSSVIELRRKNLVLLIKDRYADSQTNFSTATGISLSQIGQWLADEQNPNSRNMSERSARKIESKASLPDGWLDVDHTSDPRSPPTSSFDANVSLAEIGMRRVPLLNYVQAGQLTEVGANFSGDAMVFLLTDAGSSEHVFALEIEGLSMAPDFKPGDRVIIDRDLAPSAGDFVVARNGKEEATFKKYRPRGINERGQDVFELVPLNDDFATLYSDREHLIVIGTMVEHRRYRR